MNFSDFFKLEELIEATLVKKATGDSVDPKTGKSWRKQHVIERLKNILEKNEIDAKDLYVHYSDIPKLGIFPMSQDGQTPFGLYAYPLSYIIDQIGNVPFASVRRYMIVFKNESKNVLDIEQRTLQDNNVLSRVFARKANSIGNLTKYLIKELEIIKEIFNEIFNQNNNKIAKLIKNSLEKIFKDKKSYILSSRFNDDFLDTSKEVKKLDFNSNSNLSIETLAWNLPRDMEKFVNKDYDLMFDKVNEKDLSADLSEKQIQYEKKLGIYSGDHNSLYEILEKLNENLGYIPPHFMGNIIYWIISYDTQNSTFVKEIKRKLTLMENKFNKKIYEVRKKIIDEVESIDFNYKKEIVNYSKENNLNWMQAFWKLNTRNQHARESDYFTYDIARQLAYQESNKTKKKYYVIWTKILKMLGIEGIIDRHGTGTIYETEPTQAVFFYTTKCKILDIIIKESHISKTKEDYAKRLDGVKQRQHNIINWEPEDSAIDRWATGVILVAEKILRISQGSLHNLNNNYFYANEFYGTINKIFILIKTILTQKSKIQTSNKYKILKDTIKSIENVIIKIEAKIQEKNPQEKELISTYQKGIEYLSNFDKSDKEDLKLKKIKWQTFKRHYYKENYHPKSTKENLIKINNPHVNTSKESWHDANSMATITPEGDVLDHLHDIDFKDQKINLKNYEDFAEPPIVNHPIKKNAAGAIIIEPDNRVWILHPTNQFGGYEATFPKGKVEDGLDQRETAIKEVYEETGIHVKLIGYVGDAEKTTSITRYYLAKRIGGNPKNMGWESQGVSLVPIKDLDKVVTHPADQIIVTKIKKMFQR